MTKYRIKETSLSDGTAFYSPQYRWCGLWWSVWTQRSYDRERCVFDSFAEAQGAIRWHVNGRHVRWIDVGEDGKGKI